MFKFVLTINCSKITEFADDDKDDAKMVKFVVTINCSKITTGKQQVGSKSKTIPCPVVVKKYQADMGSIDKNDQMTLHGGGFSQEIPGRHWIH